MSHSEDTPSFPQAEAASPAPLTASPARSSWDGVAEQFARDYLSDRRSERRWRLFFRWSWLLLMVALVWAIVASRNHSSAQTGPHTALIEVHGEIADGAEASAENLMPGIKSAFEDAGAQAVVLRINLPGGSPVQAGILYDEIRRLKALHKKKVYAVVSETCA